MEKPGIYEFKPINCEDHNVPFVVPKSMMIFAAHPDDELLSCGGTIMKYRELGTKITVVVATGGKGGYAKEENKKEIEKTRAKEISTVEQLLDVEFLELGFDEVEVNRYFIAKFNRLLRDYTPQVIFLPHYTDVHRAHRNLAEIVREAIYHTATGKAYGGAGKEFMPLAVYMYESPSCKFQYIDEHIFIISDISKFWNQKLETFHKAYGSQEEVIKRVVKWAEKTALLRGNEIGAEYGEAFIPSTEYVPLRLLIV